ncbi:MAG: sugar ABC transporter permease [Armatimonadota bacterium]|nr:sugar ABC transporter permease [Armatimonadota bacterium]
MSDRRKASKLLRREAFEGYLCIAPWLIGLVFLTLGPVVFSFIMSLHRWDMIKPAQYVGLSNYATIFTDDFRFRQSLKVTAIYAACAVPLGMICSLALAMLLNLNVRGMRIFRSIFYIPAILPGVAVAMVWLTVFRPQGGVLNTLLGYLHIPPQPWLTDPRTALPSFIIMSLWGVGGGMIIYLAGLQSVPTQLYEAAEIDGAGSFSKFRNVTLPMISPTILFNLIMGVIGSFQVFTSSFILTQGGPGYATLFYVLYLYQKAFKYLQMGYACALAWILFAVILALTLVVLKSSAAWVYYEAELKR